MKNSFLTDGWHLRTSHFEGEVSLPNDYTVTVPRNPHAPGGASNGFFEGGQGRYTKTLFLENTPKHYILDIDGAYMCAAVTLNGRQLVLHPHGYTPFLVDLTGSARPGEENRLEILTDALQPSTRWYSGGGLYRDVRLWEGGEIRIEPWDMFVTTPTLERVRAEYLLSSDRPAGVTLLTEVLDREGHTVASLRQNLSLKEGKNAALAEFDVKNAHVWDTECPYLYTLRSTVTEGEEVREEDERKFGFRTVSADAKNGLLLNGKPIKLRGGCIHHDHGVLGAADYPAACLRKLTRLHDTGFNALRIAHNPPSRQLLEMCDEMGILIMDEAFDCWRIEKGGSLNYQKWFDDWWQRDIASMVLRDRNHPCVIAFSIGNEVPESAGTPDGDELSEKLSAEIRKYDPTRLVTSATFEMGGGETWAERTENYWKPLDICGYNYIYTRYEKDHERFPDRVIWGSETHALHFYDSWNLTLKSPYVIGDFTWTAYDNLGEAGTGASCWARDGFIPGIMLMDYPWRSCYQGDLDLCGYRRPQSYFREAVWLGGTEPRIFTTHPEHTGESFSGTGWHWYDVLDSWTFEEKYLGKPVRCEVYTDAEEIRWFLNGKSVGVSKPEKAIASIQIPYEKGTLTAVAFREGKETGRSSLHTVSSPAALSVKAETKSLAADGRDLCYFDIAVTDGNGDRVPDALSELKGSVCGGKLLGIFSGDPKNEDAYGSDTCHAFTGRAVAVVCADRPGAVTLTVSSPGLRDGTDTVTAG